MKRMAMLASPTHIVFFPDVGKAKYFRRLYKHLFKRRHIRDVIQAYPSKIQYGRVYEIGEEI